MSRTALVGAAHRRATADVVHVVQPARRTGPAGGGGIWGGADFSAVPARPVPGGVLVQRKCDSCAAAGPDEEPCDGCTAEPQPSLEIGPANDAFEKEADRIAAQVMTGGPASQPTPLSSRAQRAPQPADVAGAANAGAAWQPGTGEGTALDGGVRRDMERQFGRDFSQVRVHTDGRAAGAATALRAQAYTLGSHIVFAAGKYSPQAPSGRRLLAHELTHVVQQQAAPAGLVQRDLAVEPKGVDQKVRTLSQTDLNAAIAFNKTKVKDPKLLAEIRDVVGVDPQPAISDQDLALAVGRFQASHGVAQDGQLGPVTMLLLVEEMQAEGMSKEADASKALFAKGTFMDIDSTFCGCEPVLERELQSADFMIGEYTACGADPTVKDGPAAEQCVRARAKARGKPLRLLGTTSVGGGVALTGARQGKCKKLMERIDLAHEQIHSVHEGELTQAHGAGTSAFTKAREDKSDWVDNEVQSRKTDKSLATWALSILKKICP